jgi:hypothetical protein
VTNAYVASTVRLAVQRASPAGSARSGASCARPTLLWTARAWSASPVLVAAHRQPSVITVGSQAVGRRAGGRSRGRFRDLAVPRDRGTLIDGRVVPDRMVGALAQHGAPVSYKMAFEVAASQAAGARSIVTCSACPEPIGGVRP